MSRSKKGKADMTHKILLLNGPNLNLLGNREIGIYGTNTLRDIETLVIDTAKEKKCKVTCFQSNSESELIERIHQAQGHYSGIIINPAAYSHTSVALHDAIKGINIPVIEVHLSNIYARESFRHQSVTAKACIGQITGLGAYGYKLATLAIIDIITRKDDSFD